MGLNLRYAVAQFRRLIARDPRDVLMFICRRVPRIPRNMVESVRARMTKIPAGIKSHREAPKTWDALVEWASMDHPDGADAVALKWVKEGKLSLLHRTLKTGWPPKWQTKETGFWPATPSQSISYFGAGVQIDIKLVWELHRQHPTT